MLVKESIVNQWYSRRHWMFQQFSFLFQNPWWQKSIPSGFSVCPYFWASMLSFFVLRPSIMLVAVFYNFILKPLGAPLTKFENWVTPFINRVFGQRAGIKHCAGVPTVALLMICVVASALGYLTGALSTAIIIACTVNPLLIPVFVLAGIGIAMTVLIAKYKYLNAELNASCKVNYYYVVWGLAIAIAIGVSSFGGPLGLFAATWTNCIVTPAAFCWWMLADGLTTLGGWITTAAIFCWKMLVAFLSYKVGGVYWWLWAVGVFTGITLIGNWLLKQAFLNNVETFTPIQQEGTPADVEQRRNRAAWRYVIWKGLDKDVMGWDGLLSKFRTELRAVLKASGAGFTRPNYKYDGSQQWAQSVALTYNWYQWKAELLDTIFAPLLDQLQHRRCPAYFEWHATGVDLSNAVDAQCLVEDVARALSRQYGLQLVYNEQRKLETILGVVARRDSIAADFAAGLESAQREIAIQAQAEKDAEKKRANPRRSLLEVLFGSNERANELCAKTTASIAAPFVACWLLIKRVWLELQTFAAWAKIYAKSKKQGACPYITFKD